MTYKETAVEQEQTSQSAYDVERISWVKVSRPSRLRLVHVADHQVVLEILAHSGEISDNLDLLGLEMGPGTNSAQHENVRRSNSASAQHNLEPRLDLGSANELNASGPRKGPRAGLKGNPSDLLVPQAGKVGAGVERSLRAVQIPLGSVASLSVANRRLRVPHTGLLVGRVVVVDIWHAELVAGLGEGLNRRLRGAIDVAIVSDGDRTVLASMRQVAAPAVVLHSLKVLLQVFKAPARTAHLVGPLVVPARVAAHGQHVVVGGASSQDLGAGPVG